MIKLKLSKSHMENEEGMNHLWIQLLPNDKLNNIEIDLHLPLGVFRLPNLNGFPENKSGAIILENNQNGTNIFIEIYTESAISCGEKTISVDLSFFDKEYIPQKIVTSLKLEIVGEEDMDKLVIDEEVLTCLKRILNIEQDLKQYNSEEFVLYKPKFSKNRNECTYLENKYRIDL